MDCRTTILCCLTVLLVFIANTEGRNKKVVIHVPYKVKKIRHTHTVFKTIHHHHTHHDYDHGLSEDHEHFHHLHVQKDPPIGAHSQPVAGIGIPEFLPDVPMDQSLDIPDVPLHEIPGLPNRHIVPLYRRV